VDVEIEALRERLQKRDEELERSKYLLQRAKERNRQPLGTYVLFVVLLLVFGGYVAWDQYFREDTSVVEEEVRPELRFPEEYSLGSLYSRAATSRDDEDWVPEAEAQGTIYPNPDLAYHLKVDAEHADELIALTRLDPRFVQSLWLPRFEMTEENLDFIGSLRNLKDLYIDEHQPEQDVARLQERLPDALINSRPPEVVVFVEETSPPIARKLDFPAGRSLGRVFTREWSLGGNAEWRDFREARGTISIPAGQEAKLVVAAEAAPDLAPLDTMEPNSIHTVEMSGDSVTDASLSHLRNLTGLQGLNLVYTRNVTDQGFEFLDGLRRLRTLELYGVSITDEGFSVFEDCDRMQRIFLRSVPIEMKSVPLLREMKSLRTLHLEKTGIPDAGLITLKYDMPWCQVSPVPVEDA
jgi:hypothetical protein